MKKVFLFFLAVSTLLITQSCQKDNAIQNFNNETTPSKSPYPEAIAAEDLPSPATAPYIETESVKMPQGIEKMGWLNGQKIRFYDADDNTAIIDGDIAIPKSIIQSDKNEIETRGAYFSSSRPWANKIVYYQFAPQFSAVLRNSFTKACNEWNRLTGIRFVQRSSTAQTNYIYVFAGNGNYSNLGMLGGKQQLSLNDANVGVAIHELGHALGMIHEHQRNDRDNVIIINTVADYSSILQKFSASHYTAFDWSSIMMYGSKPLGNGTFDMVGRSDRRAFTNTIESAKAVGRYALPSTSDVNLIRAIYR